MKKPPSALTVLNDHIFPVLFRRLHHQGEVRAGAGQQLLVDLSIASKPADFFRIIDPSLYFFRKHYIIYLSLYRILRPDTIYLLHKV